MKFQKKKKWELQYTKNKRFDILFGGKVCWKRIQGIF